MKAKLESKVAKTIGLLTAGVISLTIPVFLFAILGNSMPLFRSNVATRFTQIVTQLNSLFNPLLYCYRDKRFRDAIRKLLGLKKSQPIQSAVCAAQHSLRKDPPRSSELHWRKTEIYPTFDKICILQSNWCFRFYSRNAQCGYVEKVFVRSHAWNMFSSATVFL